VAHLGAMAFSGIFCFLAIDSENPEDYPLPTGIYFEKNEGMRKISLCIF
jgi:hypothetical protein